MPSAARIRTLPARSEPLFLFDARRPVRNATPEMIEKVIDHADICIAQCNGRMKLRVSETMIAELQAQGRLGLDDHRLADLTIVWDPQEGQVISVRDDARLRDASNRWAEWDALWDEDSYQSEPQRQAA